MTRPELTPDLPATELHRWYWLKAELLAFCRRHTLSPQGSKAELTARIAAFLATGARPALAPAVRRQRAALMPTQFTRDTVIGPGWRCSEPLRTFFRQELGPHFHFDGVMRTFIAEGVGRPLAEAIRAWEQPREPASIAPQFEYNRHLRAYFTAHPQATRVEALAAWRAQKAQRRAAASGDGS